MHLTTWWDDEESSKKSEYRTKVLISLAKTIIKMLEEAKKEDMDIDEVIDCLKKEIAEEEI